MEQSSKICAVIVTFNRKALLQECLEALDHQTLLCQKIVVVNNASTDGTKEFLQDWQNNDKRKEVITLPKNIGGSGGFFEGIKLAFNQGFDFVWCMDDDTVAQKNSLEELMKLENVNEKVGFICSKVFWKEGEIHLMNIPQLEFIVNNVPFNQYDDKNAIVISNCSFVSALIKREVIGKCGLPYKEFFIWGDDAEYTKRVANRGFIGVYASKSVVFHKTKENYGPHFIQDKKENAWKYFYEVRNRLFLMKRDNFLKFIIYFFHSLLIRTSKVLILRKDGKCAYWRAIMKGTLASIFFSPRIKYAKEEK